MKYTVIHISLDQSYLMILIEPMRDEHDTSLSSRKKCQTLFACESLCCVCVCVYYSFINSLKPQMMVKVASSRV